VERPKVTGLTRTKSASEEERFSEHLDDEYLANWFEAEPQVGVHRKTIAVIDYRDNPLPVPFQH
jgi:hypothetical protein